MKNLFFKILAVFLLQTIFFQNIYAERHKEFITTKELRGRVDFWIDIFAKYGKYQAVFHHREYPQATFDVMDFSHLANKLNSVQLDKHIQKAKKDKISEINKIIKDLQNGRNPSSALARKIKDAFLLVPGNEKSQYERAVKEDLVRSQTGIKERYEEAIIRSGRYMPIIENIFVNEFHLPIELTRLPFVESSFDYKAYSSVGAAGIWQFMPSTARSYMKVNNLIDERRDVITATRSAAKYLKSAYQTLGHWPLAVTSYNHGVAGVNRKVKKIGITDISKIVEHPTERIFGFASNNFFPELLAAIEIYDKKYKYFPNVKIEQPHNVVEYKLSYATSVRHIQSRLNISQEDLRSYNYAIAERVWNGSYRIPAGYVLKVPYTYKQQLVHLKSPEPTTASSSVIYGVGTYKVRKGDNLISISKKYGLSVKELKELNQLKSNNIYIGQTLIVNDEQKSNSETTSKGSKYHTIRKGENLAIIAKKYNTSISNIQKLNGLKSTKIIAGKKLRVG